MLLVSRNHYYQHHLHTTYSNTNTTSTSYLLPALLFSMRMVYKPHADTLVLGSNALMRVRASKMQQPRTNAIAQGQGNSPGPQQHPRSKAMTQGHGSKAKAIAVGKGNGPGPRQ